MTANIQLTSYFRISLSIYLSATKNSPDMSPICIWLDCHNSVCRDIEKSCWLNITQAFAYSANVYMNSKQTKNQFCILSLRCRLVTGSRWSFFLHFSKQYINPSLLTWLRLRYGVCNEKSFFLIIQKKKHERNYLLRVNWKGVQGD